MDQRDTTTGIEHFFDVNSTKNLNGSFETNIINAITEKLFSSKLNANL